MNNFLYKFFFGELLDVLGEEIGYSSNFNRLKILLKKRKKQRSTLLLLQRKKEIRKVPKVLGFLKTIRSYPDDIFFTHFRMNRKTFEKLKITLKPFWSERPGRTAYPLECCLYVTLWRLSNNNSFREISDRFNIGYGTIYDIFIRTIKKINKLKSLVIKFPKNPVTQTETMRNFESSRREPYPSVIGCIDGMHVKISKPLSDSISYYNRKGFYSVLVQGVVNSSYQFLDVFVGYPGRSHDAAMWNDSPLQKAIANKEIIFYYNSHLIGDSAYPLQTFLITPYKDNGFLTVEQKHHNSVLSSTRVFVEQAFGILKQKFRILHYLNLQNLQLAKYIIMACIILHNIIIENEGCNAGASDLNEVEEDEEIISTIIVQTDENAKKKRDTIAALLSS